MNCLSRVSHYTAAILGRTAHLIPPVPKPTTLPSSYNPSLSLPPSKHILVSASVKSAGLESLLQRFRAHCYSSGAVPSSKKRSKSKKKESRETRPMEQDKEERDSFFVVRKGDIVGVYKTFSECQAQIGSSICDPPVSIYKGYSLPKDSERYLLSHGFQNALYTITAADLKEDLFGALVPCTFQQSSSSIGETNGKDVAKKRSHGVVESENREAGGSTTTFTEISRKHAKVDAETSSQTLNSESFCILEFDGASKGNPGRAGAGAVLRAANGSLICRLREGLGVATNNVAEYRAMLLGMKYALQKGYTNIRIQGDSKLVCMQIQGLWKVKHQNMSTLYEQAITLKDRFLSFQISHVLREYNSEADAQANLAINLADGQIQEEFL